MEAFNSSLKQLHPHLDSRHDKQQQQSLIFHKNNRSMSLLIWALWLVIILIASEEEVSEHGRHYVHHQKIWLRHKTHLLGDV